MAYTRPGDFSELYIFSASDFNVYIRDNFKAAIPDIFTAAGDLAVGVGADEITTLSAVSYHCVRMLTSMSSALVWHRAYTTFWEDELGGEASSGSGEKKAGIYDGAVAITLEDIDNWDAVTPEYKISVAGYYLVSCHADISLTEPDWRLGVTGFFRVENNGTVIAETAIICRTWPDANDGDWNTFVPLYASAQLSFIYNFSVDDVLEFIYNVTTTGGIKTYGERTHNRGSLTYLGAA